MAGTQRLVARIGKAHGLRGEVTVQVHTDAPDDRFVPGARFVTAAQPGSGVPRELRLATARMHQQTWLLSFEGIGDRTGAQGLRGTRLLSTDPDDGAAPSSPTPSGADEGWYPEELVGLRVRDPAGSDIGVVSELRVGTAQDLLGVHLSDGRRGLVPFVTALVPRVEPGQGFVVVNAPGGLFDLEQG